MTKASSIPRLLLHLFLLGIMVSFESTFGLAWLSIFLIQQIVIRSSDLSSWVIIILASLFISAAFSVSTLLVFGLLVLLWLYPGMRSLYWWIIYLFAVLIIGWQGIESNIGSMIWQTIISLLLLIFYVRGVIWWPRIWKNNEKII